MVGKGFVHLDNWSNYYKQYLNFKSEYWFHAIFIHSLKCETWRLLAFICGSFVTFPTRNSMNHKKKYKTLGRNCTLPFFRASSQFFSKQKLPKSSQFHSARHSTINKNLVFGKEEKKGLWKKKSTFGSGERWPRRIWGWRQLWWGHWQRHSRLCQLRLL